MIHPIVKLITVDGYYSKQQAIDLWNVILDLPYEPMEFGEQIKDFNLVAPDADKTFSNILGSNMSVDQESGVFRRPETFIHFEPFQSLNEWKFAVALKDSTFNVFEHRDGATTALQGHMYNYRNLFEWNLTINYVLKEGQGILFRPWLFHTFDNGLIQIFNLKEIDER